VGAGRAPSAGREAWLTGEVVISDNGSTMPVRTGLIIPDAAVPSAPFDVITVPSPLVDPILDVLRALRVLDGMETEQHYGFKPSETKRLFGDAGFVLEKHEKFELGLNELFVFRRPDVATA
jgi:hypothetical protein